MQRDHGVDARHCAVVDPGLRAADVVLIDRFLDAELSRRNLPPTAEGIYDLAGNVWEWVWDRKVQALPVGGLRGGSWATRSRLVHPRMRNFYKPGRHDVFAGFRTCARD